ncbi:MAG: tubulin-tyrosine ligase family-domain-containing protein [Monoraphidium minutum]|nr:MAG: tubulin-tyrosine ligase family-domain-containing protein [Monoraphidium minutum]
MQALSGCRALSVVACSGDGRSGQSESTGSGAPSSAAADAARRAGERRRTRAQARQAHAPFLRRLWLVRAAGGGGPPGWPLGAPALALAAVVPRPLPDPARFRYWVDYQALASPESAALAERALQMLGGVRTGGPPKLDPVSAQKQKIKDYGYMHMGSWDLLLSITAKAMLAAEVLRPGQLVSIVPGCLAISRKTSLVRSLLNAYGPDVAFGLVPLTFKLPEELDDWAAWVRAHPGEASRLWMLKNNKQRGTGLRLVAAEDAFSACFETCTRPGLEGMRLYRWYLAQRYVTDPLLINGRKFGLRLWALVPGAQPLRAYLHANGLALFSSEPYRPEDAGKPCAAGVAAGHVTNYAQNENGDVWDLQRLAAHVGAGRWAGLWRQCLSASALVFAAALRRIQEVQAQMDLPPKSTFQYFGLDFLVDAALHPWLMEVNATPSMKVAHEDPATCNVIHDAKWPVVRDMFAMMMVGPQRFSQEPGGHEASLSEVEAELQLRGGFLPLMHLFPREDALPGLSIPWTPADAALAAWAAASPAYQAAAAAAT